MSKSQPSLDRVVGYSLSELLQLRQCRKVTRLAPVVNTSSDWEERGEILYYLKSTIREMRQSPQRNLPLDLEGCHYAYYETLDTHIVEAIKTRGFYEPDTHYSGQLQGVYLCCSLKSSPSATASISEIASTPLTTSETFLRDPMSYGLHTYQQATFCPSPLLRGNHIALSFVTDRTRLVSPQETLFA